MTRDEALEIALFWIKNAALAHPDREGLKEAEAIIEAMLAETDA
jgi:hypothetical protein